LTYNDGFFVHTLLLPGVHRRFCDNVIHLDLVTKLVVGLPVLPTRSRVTLWTAEHHHPLVSTKSYCLVTEVHVCEQPDVTSAPMQTVFQNRLKTYLFSGSFPS